MLRLDGNDRRNYDHYMENLSDETSVFQTYFEDGKYEGKTEGLKKSQSHVVRNIKKKTDLPFLKLLK